MNHFVPVSLLLQRFQNVLSACGPVSYFFVFVLENGVCQELWRSVVDSWKRMDEELDENEVLVRKLTLSSISRYGRCTLYLLERSVKSKFTQSVENMFASYAA